MTIFLLAFIVFTVAFAALAIGGLWGRALDRSGCSKSSCAGCEKRSH